MNMIMSDLASSVNVGSSRADATRAGTNASATGPVYGGNAFEQLLAQMMNGAAGPSMGRAPIMSQLLIQQQLSMLGEGMEGEASSLVEWLSQSLELLEDSSEEFTAMMAEHPQLLPILASLIGMTTDGVDGAAVAPDRQKLGSGAAEQLPGQLKEVMQHLMTKLTTNQVTADTVQQVKAFQQLMMPILEASQLHHDIVHTQHNVASTRTFANHGHSVVVEEFTAWMQHDASKVYASNGQSIAHTSMPSVDSNAMSTPASSTNPMLHRAELLRPQHLQLLIGEMGSELPTDRLASEVTPSSSLWTGDYVRSGHEWSMTRSANASLPQVPVQAFADEMNQFVLRSFQVTQLNGLSEAKISLVPEHLGQVDIKLTMHNGQLTAQLVTETALGRDMLEQQLGQLRQSLQSQGIQVERLEVTQQSSSTTNFLRDQGQHQQQPSYQGQRQAQADQHSYEENAPEFELELELVGQDYGTYTNSRSFHATA